MGDNRISTIQRLDGLLAAARAEIDKLTAEIEDRAKFGETEAAALRVKGAIPTDQFAEFRKQYLSTPSRPMIRAYPVNSQGGQMIKVANEVTIYEENGKETSVPAPTLSVQSHWNRDSLIVLEVAGQKVVVSARDLQAAVANAVNTARHG